MAPSNVKNLLKQYKHNCFEYVELTMDAIELANKKYFSKSAHGLF